jgi:type I restriction enzyme S subunit
MTAVHPVFGTLLRSDWQVMSVDELKAPEKSSCVAGPFGSNISSKYFVPEGVPVIRGSNLTDDLTKFVAGQFVFVSPDRALSYRAQHVRAGDLVFTCWGTIGQVGLIPDDGPYDEYIISNKQLKLRPDPSRTDARFLFYYFASPAMVEHIRNRAIGSAVPGINLGILKSLPVVLPPLSTQHKIVAILSAFDDLIDNNNNHRIKLLEEMAQRIYREWFVDFRYPGHENVPLVDSELGPVPQGWSVERMDRVADVIDCLHSKKPSSTDDGTGVLLQLFNIGSGGIIDLSQIYKIAAADYEQWTSRIELRGGDCVVTNVGRIAAVAQIPPELRAAPGRNMTAIRPRAVPPTYLLQYLLSDHMDHEVQKKKDAGSIMDSLNVKGIVKLAVPVPSDSLALRFEQLGRPIRREVELLVMRQQNLRAIRDYLLPRLISGQVDVADLDIAIPEAAL